MNPIPVDAIKSTLSDARLQNAIYSSTARLMDKRAHAIAPDAIDDFQGLRTQANAIKRHAIDNLDYYLEQLEQNVIAREGRSSGAAMPARPSSSCSSYRARRA